MKRLLALMMVVAATAVLLACTKGGDRKDGEEGTGPEPQHAGADTMTLRVVGDAADGITHVGIYVGGNHMLHCGSPIGYADLTESYWRKHFYAFGRVPYER